MTGEANQITGRSRKINIIRLISTKLPFALPVDFPSGTATLAISEQEIG